MADDASDAGMEGGFADAGKGDTVDFRVFRQDGIDFGDDVVRGEIFLPFTGEIGGGAAFAVNTIHGAGLEREQVDAEGKPEPAGWDGSENTFCLNLFHVSSKIL